MTTAMITGASRGFGLAVAERLARDGWRLVVDGRDPVALQRATAELSQHGEVVAVAGDVTDPDHRAALTAAATRTGGIDLLIHNASTLGASPLPPLDEVAVEVLERTYAVNLVAPVVLTQALMPQLRSGATVVAITSDAAVEPYEGWGVYGGSKAALEHTFAIWGLERPDLRMLVVDPGDMRTRMHQDAFPGEDISDRPTPASRVPGLLTLLASAETGRHRVADVLAATS